MAKEYKALGGVTDYSNQPNKLVADAHAWLKFLPGERFPVLLEIYHQNALTAGATLGNINAIAVAARCFECIQDQDIALLYLTCFLGVHAHIT